MESWKCCQEIKADERDTPRPPEVGRAGTQSPGVRLASVWREVQSLGAGGHEEATGHHAGAYPGGRYEGSTCLCLSSVLALSLSPCPPVLLTLSFCCLISPTWL